MYLPARSPPTNEIAYLHSVTDHCILLPDANQNFALNSIVGAAFGAAGALADLELLCTLDEAVDPVLRLADRDDCTRVPVVSSLAP
jgi:hypothetical protein